MKLCLMIVLALALCLPALADDALSLPDGRQFRLEAKRLGEQYRAEEYETEGIYMLNLMEGEAVFQQLFFTTLESGEEGPFIRTEDLNFDGYPDLDITYALGNANSRHIFFFYDQDTGKYEPWAYGSDWISNYILDAEKGYLINYTHDSAVTGQTAIYRWEGKQLQLLRLGSLTWDEYDPHLVRLTVTDYSYHPARQQLILEKSLDVAQASEEEVLSLMQEMEAKLWEGLK